MRPIVEVGTRQIEESAFVGDNERSLPPLGEVRPKAGKGEVAARISFSAGARQLPPPPLRGPSAAAFHRRLDRTSHAPLIVAFSGGGDSLALLIAAKAWADEAGRRIVAVTVDHRLQAAGAEWALWCEARCRRLGVEHRTLVWTGDKPATGLAAAARVARHGLIAEAARDAGAKVILMGHTADDRLEARLMRAAGASLAEPREWSPSPLWPQGRGLFILRPLVEARRSGIRQALSAAGETWIEDPANVDPRQARARARAALAGGGEAGPLEEPPPGGALMAIVAEGPAGDLAIDRARLAQAPAGAARALIGAALLSAAGTSRPPRGERLDRLLGRLAAGERFVATLAGARLEAAGQLIRITREGVARRPLPIGAPMIWDGRFEIEARAPGLAVGALAGRGARLDHAFRVPLKAVPPAARLALPALIDQAGAVTCPSLLPDPRVTVRSLIWDRLAGALGATDCEAAIASVAKALPTT